MASRIPGGHFASRHTGLAGRRPPAYTLRDMTIHPYTGGMVQTNGYLVESGDQTLVIDAPGGMAEFVAQRNRKPTALLLTHQHFDHVEDAAAIAREGAPIYAWAGYSGDLVLDEAARRWGMPVTIDPFEVDQLLAGTAELTVGGVRLQLLHVPGHSPDSVAFYEEGSGQLLAGDTLFAGSIGRTDLPGGDHNLLLQGIREKLFILPPETTVLSGHGPSTTIGQERAQNPFLA